MNYKDCYAELNDDRTDLTIGNSLIEKSIQINGCFVRTVGVTDLRSGREWGGEARVWQHCPTLKADERLQIALNCEIVDGKSRMADHLKVVLQMTGREGCAWYEYVIFPEIPFIYQQIYVQQSGSADAVAATQETRRCDGVENGYTGSTGEVFCDSDVIECLPLSRAHMTVESFQLYDKTDIHDCLLERADIPVYSRFKTEREGNLFCINDYPHAQSLLLVKHSPTPGSALNRRNKDLVIVDDRYAMLMGNGVDFNNMPACRIPYYACAIGVAPSQSIWEDFWRYCNAFSSGDASRSLFTMSNTWGDRSQDMAVCESFLLGELEIARELGVDIVQIDDGWQCGVTANSLRKKGGVWEGYYGYDNDFWAVNSERFPNGLEPLINKAAEYGIKFGLWFSPDSSNDFANVERDIETLWNLHRRYGVEYFKLDGIKIRSKLGEARFIHMLHELSERGGGNIRFNLDVTAEDRFGYLYEAQYGTLFVENRYTDWANYYPHNTFKNLWMLSSILPARRLQMELLNPRRNDDKYAQMPFAPMNYRMDYLFATVMPANPLLWMELSHLAAEDRLILKKIMRIYKQYQRELFEVRVMPIGRCPDGMSFSGYLCENKGTRSGHMLLFRETTADSEYAFALPFEYAELSTVYASAPVDYNMEHKAIRVRFDEPRSFVWIKYQLA